ncbi:unnamed protein product [Paramecium octaurelia]|uniref:RING-type domain-containing protein n=1 Tax=Paramecium octaurelia TaxID=43137 RepID=A0A8S1TP02_PAROT|nr:unnamed protein product [Paramecium octaurelia]
MEFYSTDQIVDHKQNIPIEIWNQFLCKFPYCSIQKFKLPADARKEKSKFLSALLIANFFDIIISLQQLTKLEQIQQQFQQILDDQNQSHLIKNRFQNYINQFQIFLDELKPFDFIEIQGNQSNTETTSKVQDSLKKKIKKIYDYLSDQQKVNILFQLSIGIALSFYLNSDSQVTISATLQIDQKTKNQIVNRLLELSNVDAVHSSSQNDFFAEDYIAIAISNLLNYPIHFFINEFDKDREDLMQRKIHQEQNQDKVVAFLIDGVENDLNVRILASNQDTRCAQNIINKKQQQQQKSIVNSLQQIFDNILDQVMEDFCNLNELWILQILQIIKHGGSQSLITDRKPININQQFIQYSQELFQQLKFDPTAQQEFLKNFEEKLQKKEQVVENIIISQFQTIRDQIQGRSQEPQQSVIQFQKQSKSNFAVCPKPKEVDDDIPQNVDFDQVLKSQIKNNNLNNKLVDHSPKRQNQSKSEIDNRIKLKTLNDQKKCESSIVNHEEMLSIKKASLIYRQTISSKVQSEINSFSNIEKNKFLFTPSIINQKSQIKRQSEINIIPKTLNSSQISETLKELSSSIASVEDTFKCTICCCEYKDPDEIKTLHDDHKLCKFCLGSWIKVKFNSTQWNFKYFKCPIQSNDGKTQQPCDHAIEQQQIQNVLTAEEFDLLIVNTIKNQIVDIICPNQDCRANIKGIPPVDRNELLCPICSIKICCVCKQIDHIDSKCPQRLEEIKLALQDERISCCPGCLEIYMKNGGCEHFSCTKCFTEFCFGCSAYRKPILGHGAHFHREGCSSRKPWYQDQDKKIENLDEEYIPDQCEYCKQYQRACPRPISLSEFKSLAHLNFENNQM